MENNSSRREIQSVRKALNILEHVNEIPSGASLAGISRALDMNRNTAFQLLSTLCACGYLAQESDTKLYVPGSQLYKLSHADSLYRNLVVQSRPILEYLAATTRETAHIAVMEGANVVFLDKVEPDQSLCVITDLKSKMPIHNCSVGKAIMAYLPERDFARVLPTIRYEKHTERSILSQEALLFDLAGVRQEGYATDDNEFYLGIRCVAVPIFDQAHYPIASLGVSAPEQRINDFAIYAGILKECSRKISVAMSMLPH